MGGKQQALGQSKEKREELLQNVWSLSKKARSLAVYVLAG
jgi:hypothetical protein